MRLAVHLPNACGVTVAIKRAVRAVRPALSLKMLAGFVCVGKDRVVEVVGYGGFPTP